MRTRNLNQLIDSCAELASKGKNVSSYIILYQMKNGDVNYARGGQLTTQVGLMELAKSGMLNGMTEKSNAQKED